MAFEIENGVLKRYKEKNRVTKALIPKRVTSIGDGAFLECKNLEEIIIPNSVTNIGWDAFWGCEKLKEITIPNSVINIGSCAFYGCKNLKKIIIPDSVNKIGQYAFSNCKNLEDIKVDDMNKNYCDIDGVLFNKDKTFLIKYPIGKHKNIYIVLDSVKSIGCDAFSGCENLVKIIIPDSVKSIGNNAFGSCKNLKSVIIPESITQIDTDAFSETQWLNNYPDDFVIVGDNILIKYKGSDKKLIIPDSVTSIDYNAFNDCKNFNQVTFYGVTFKPQKLKDSDFNFAMEMIKIKDFSIEFNRGVKNAVIIGYYLKTEDETAETFIKKGFARIFKWLIDNEDVETVTKLLNTGKFVTKKNIDKFIEYAIENKKMEIQVILMNYKNDNFGFDVKKTFRI